MKEIKTLTIKVHLEFYQMLKIHLIKENISLKDYFIELVKNDLEKN